MLMIRSLPSGWDNNGRQLQWRQSRRAGRRPSKKRSTMLGSITHGVLLRVDQRQRHHAAQFGIDRDL
jgi:hypothetical protein